MLNQNYKNLLKRLAKKPCQDSVRERLEILETLINDDKLVFIPKIGSTMYGLFIDGIHATKVKSVTITKDFVIVTDFDGCKSYLDYDIFYTYGEAQQAMEALEEYKRGTL